jgi:hypothetical protein
MKSWLSEVRYSNDFDRMLEEDDCYYNEPISKYDVRFPSELETVHREWVKVNRKNKYIEVAH